MAGIRIHHIELRDCTFLIHHPGEIKTFFRTKNRGRKPKDYHIRLDYDGNCIVSETVWTRIQEAGSGNKFVIINEVLQPPTLHVGLKEGTYDTPAVYKEIEGAVREIAPPGVKTYIGRYDG